MSDNEFMTILSYVKTCLKSFDELPLNEVDNVVLCWLSYLNLHEDVSNNFSDEGMSLLNLLRAEYYSELLDNYYDHKEETLQFMYSVIANPRYRNTRIKYYRNENSTELSLQFSAMVFSLSETSHFIAYRGTDHALHSWKEDVMLLLNQAAPCQMMSVNYLNAVAQKLKGELIVGGHSKGGHNAVYAAAFCKPEVQQRITAVYSDDGPGFLQNDLQSDGMKRIQGRVHKIIPLGSPVGLILSNEVQPKFTESNLSGFLKHYPTSWRIEGNAFKSIPPKNQLADKLTQNINRWAESVSDVELTVFINTLFELIESTGMVDSNVVMSNPGRFLKLFAEKLASTDKKNRHVIISNLAHALSGKTGNSKQKDETDLREFGIDWSQIDQILNERETANFQNEFNLFIP